MMVAGFESLFAIRISVRRESVGILVGIGRHSDLEANVGVGLAGDRKEQMRVKAVVNHGF